MNRILMHLVFIAIAVTITVVGFNFWGQFGHAMGNLSKLAAPQAAAPHAAAPASGIVTMSIVTPGAKKPDCTKERPCK